MYFSTPPAEIRVIESAPCEAIADAAEKIMREFYTSKETEDKRLITEQMVLALWEILRRHFPDASFQQKLEIKDRVLAIATGSARSAFVDAGDRQYKSNG